MMNKILIEELDNSNHRITTIYIDQIWNQNNYAVNKVNNNNVFDLVKDQHCLKFLKDSMKFFNNDYFVKVTLYDKHGKAFLSSKDIDIVSNEGNIRFYNKIIYSIDEYFLNNPSVNNGLNLSLKGYSNNYIILDGILKDNIRNNDINSRFFISYIPIFQDNKINGVIEIVIDISSQLNLIINLQNFTFISFFIICIIFLIVVVYNTNYTQQLIEQQFKANQILKEEKIKAESESSSKLQFFANVSHELRTPLNSIIGFSDIILSETHGKLNNPEYTKYVQDILSSGKHLLSIINDILDFSKAASDKLKVDNMQVDLNKLISSVIRMFKYKVENSKIELIQNSPKKHLVIVADPKRLKQVILNLLSNALKFTSQGSITVNIIEDIENKKALIEVIDTGIGMEEKDIPRALSSFGQIDNALSRKYKGTGLGLPLTKKLIELMKGEFIITSKIGKGTKITIIFPYHDIE